MHRIIATHLKSFSVNQGLHLEKEDVQFERFSNYAILSGKAAVSFDLDDVSTGIGDDGMDGVAILINEEVVVSSEECDTVFSSTRKNHDVEVVFIQAKTSESFDLGEFLKFKESIIRFCSNTTYTAEDEIQQEARKIFDTAINNVPKIKNGKPSLCARYVCTGLYKSPPAFETAKREFIDQVEELGIFDQIDLKFIDRDSLTKLWVSTYSGTYAKIEMFSVAAMPTIAGVEEAYLGIVKAKEIVEKLLKGEDGAIRTQVFEENVRSFLGSENPVNTAIAETLSKGAASNRFPVLNNGITIVSPDVRVQNNIIHLSNYQIVNGCQTSHVLWEKRNSLDDGVMVSLKVVETNNEDIFAELVTATNSQSKIEKNQFYSLRPLIKRVEKYFDSFGEEEEGRLYFERRDRQFVGRDIPALRVCSMYIAAKCVGAMFGQRPDLSFKYPKTLYEELGEEIFSDEVKEVVFYASCLALYRIHLLCASGSIPQNIKRYKWHMLPVIRSLICDTTEYYKLSSNKTARQAEEIAKALKGSTGNSVIKQASKIVLSIDNLTVDRLKRNAVIGEILEKLPPKRRA